MKKEVVPILISPCCKKDMHINILSIYLNNRDSEIDEGVLFCSRCTREFPIFEGIPRLCNELLPSENEALKKLKAKSNLIEHIKSDMKSDVYERIEELVREKIKADGENEYLRNRSKNDISFRIRGCEKQEKYIRTLRYYYNGEVNSILDIGGGQGGLIHCCNKHLKPSLSILLDYDLSWVKVAKLRNPSITVVRADAANIPFKKDSFDLVISQACLEHIPNYKQAINEMCRVSRDALFLAWNPNKFFVYDFGHLDAPVAIFPKSIAKYVALIWHKIRQTKRTLSSIIDELNKTFYISTTLVKGILKKYGEVHNVFTIFVLNSLDASEAGRFAKQKALLVKYKFFSKAFLNLLVFLKIEPQCYYILRKTSNSTVSINEAIF